MTTTQNISPQYRYQLRHKANGLCRNCDKPLENATYCAEHNQKRLAQQRKYRVKKSHPKDNTESKP